MQEIFPETAERVQKWSEDPEVLGVLLVGSKSHGHADELSDDDLEVLLTPEAHAKLAPSDCVDELIQGEDEERKLIYDAQYTTLAELKLKPTSPLDLDHWPYEQARTLFDRNNDVALAVSSAAHMNEEFRRLRLLYATIDAWIAPYRAAKTLKRGAVGANNLLVARGAKAMSRILFALEHRWVPLDHWLEAELLTLDDPEQVGPLLVEALTSGKSEPLTEGLKRLERRLADEGVPRPPQRRDLFLELIHHSRAGERAIHTLP